MKEEAANTLNPRIALRAKVLRKRKMRKTFSKYSEVSKYLFQHTILIMQLPKQMQRSWDSHSPQQDSE